MLLKLNAHQKHLIFSKNSKRFNACQKHLMFVKKHLILSKDSKALNVFKNLKNTKNQEH